MSHSIRKLAFGVGYPGQTNPLDNHVAISTEEEVRGTSPSLAHR